MRKLLIAIILILPGILTASNQFDKSAYYNYGTKFYAETHFMPSRSADSVKAVVIFKIMNDILTFTQVNPLENPGNFLAKPSVEIAFKDEDGIIRKRDIWRDSVYLKSFAETNSKSDYVVGFFEFTMPNDIYEVTLTLNDQFATNLDEVKNKFDHTFEYAKKSMLGNPIFATKSKNNPAIFNPIILNGKVPFQSSDITTIIPVSTNDINDVYNYSVKKTKDYKNKIWSNPVNFSGRADLSYRKYLTPAYSDSYYVLNLKSDQIDDANSMKFGYLTFPMPSNVLVPGEYEMQVWKEGTKDTLTSNFEVIWENMPLSLSTADYAVERMYYILTDEEYDKMKQGSDDEKFAKIVAWWKSQDPTPETPYNESMAEYFRRVDYAFFNYQTATQKDGSKTDRGKIYILNGPPDSVSDNPKSSSNQEIWTYKRLNKQFTFEVITSGVYRLVDIADLSKK